MLMVSRHRDTGNVHADPAQAVPRSKIQRRPIRVAPGYIGGLRACGDRPQVCAFVVENPAPARPCAIDIALHIDLHAVRNADAVILQGCEDAIGGHRQQPCWLDVEGANMAATGVIDIEHPFIG
jgi:hypothetical protein